MKISTMVRDTYICKIYLLAFSFLLPMLVVLAGERKGSTAGKVVFIMANLYILGLMLRWSVRYTFISYLKRWDNGKEVNFSVKRWVIRYAVLLFNAVFYLFCIVGNAELRVWGLFLVIYKLSLDISMGELVISDNYLLFRKRTVIIKNIKAFDMKENSRLLLIFLDECKKEFRVKSGEVKEIKRGLQAAVPGA
ncbi:MAG: hypothetical protein Q8930_12440 [Bacillota bacterium]|nr:hypothetical protein [Bacillota bacterium]